MDSDKARPPCVSRDEDADARDNDRPYDDGWIEFDEDRDVLISEDRPTPVVG